ncbi:MAG TPA: creatininase family protein [Bryobacteraceae bacterium]|nr:creatininase family protein [Bryobacteraceae bacterium]
MRAFIPIMFCACIHAQTNPLWHEQKVKNYLPHMTWPEVQDLLTRSDMVIIPIASIEQHGPQGPLGTDFLAANERAKLVAQKTDVLVAPVLMPGISPYHMEFPGTITLSPDTVQRVYFEAVQSLIHHGFHRFLFLNGHAGNQYVTRFIIDRINQETSATALELGDAAAPFLSRNRANPAPAAARVFDRHAGVGETSSSMYLFPNLMSMDKAGKNDVTLPEHLAKMLPQVEAGDPAATQIFLAEALKPKDTGKHTSTREMTATGSWSNRDTRESTAERGRDETESFVNAAVQFIDRWKTLEPLRQ